LRQSAIVLIADPFRHETRLEEQLPEPVGEAGKVMAGRRGADTGIDPDKQHAYIRLDAVTEGWEHGTYDESGKVEKQTS
jgi:hypothetical protein